MISSVSFCGNSRNRDLKKLWTDGKLPTVKYGFYGEILTPENISREHLRPASKGGTKSFGNIVLVSMQNNQVRGNSDILDFASKEHVNNYLEQFKQIKLPKFDGMKYVSAVISRLKSLKFFLL